MPFFNIHAKSTWRTRNRLESFSFIFCREKVQNFIQIVLENFFLLFSFYKIGWEWYFAYFAFFFRAFYLSFIPVFIKFHFSLISSLKKFWFPLFLKRNSWKNFFLFNWRNLFNDNRLWMPLVLTVPVRKNGRFMFITDYNKSNNLRQLRERAKREVNLFMLLTGL